MAYHLRYFSDFITEHFTDNDSAKIAADFKKLKQQLRDHCTHTHNQLLADVSSFTTHQQQGLYIRNQQMIITNTLDKLDSVINFHPVSEVYQITDTPDVFNLAKLLYIALEEMLNYLHTYFAPYFDFSADLPQLYRGIKACDLKQDADYLIEVMRKSGIDKDLLTILELPFNNFTATSSDTKASFHQYFYLKGLLNGIYTLVSDGWVSIDIYLPDLLHSRNFNALAFRDYCTARFQRELDKLSDLPEKKQLLSALLIKTKRHCPLPGLIWIPGYPPLKDLLLLWLEDELNLLEGKLTPGTGLKLLTSADPVIKMQSAMTVPQMAHMLRLMLETGVYINVPPIDAIRLHSKMFTTRQSADLSSEHFRQRYYTPDSPTAAAVRDLLLKMIHHSKKLSP